MAAYGIPSTCAGGYGKKTKKGYRRLYDVNHHRYRMEQVVVWERHNGPIPPGFQVHHKNEDKLCNEIENLELVDPLTHKRIHSGCELRDGEWYKPCRACGEMLHISNYAVYPSLKCIMYRCRRCDTAIRNEQRRKRREQTKSQLAAGIGKRGNPCSKHNVACDQACAREAAAYLARLGREVVGG